MLEIVSPMTPCYKEYLHDKSTGGDIIVKSPKCGDQSTKQSIDLRRHRCVDPSVSQMYIIFEVVISSNK